MSDSWLDPTEDPRRRTRVAGWRWSATEVEHHRPAQAVGYRERVRVERGTMGNLPWAAVGSGPPVVLLPGLTPVTGVAGDTTVRVMLAPARELARERRVFAVNRRAGLPVDLTMSDLAGEHADALRSFFGGPVDVVGLSTGGSIAQQLAAEHPDTVRWLALLSTACRLGVIGRAAAECRTRRWSAWLVGRLTGVQDTSRLRGPGGNDRRGTDVRWHSSGGS